MTSTLRQDLYRLRNRSGLSAVPAEEMTGKVVRIDIRPDDILVRSGCHSYLVNRDGRIWLNAQISDQEAEFVRAVTADSLTRRRRQRPRPKRTCPRCGSDRVARIVYGLVPNSPELQRGLDEGLISLGGCVVGHDSPDFECQACGKKWCWRRSGGLA